MRLRTIVIGIAVAGVAFAGSTLAMLMLWPSEIPGRQPALAERQKLQLVTADLNFSRKVRDSSYSQYISSLTEEFE